MNLWAVSKDDAEHILAYRKFHRAFDVQNLARHLVSSASAGFEDDGLHEAMMDFLDGEIVEADALARMEEWNKTFTIAQNNVFRALQDLIRIQKERHDYCFRSRETPPTLHREDT